MACALVCTHKRGPEGWSDMDPKATLEGVISWISFGDLGEARRLLNEYRAWRRKGGFRPSEPSYRGLSGDDLAAFLDAELWDRHMVRFTILVRRPSKRLIALIESGCDGGNGEYDEILPKRAHEAMVDGVDYDIPCLEYTPKGAPVVYLCPLSMSPAASARAAAFVKKHAAGLCGQKSSRAPSCRAKIAP